MRGFVAFQSTATKQTCWPESELPSCQVAVDRQTGPNLRATRRKRNRKDQQKAWKSLTTFACGPSLDSWTAYRHPGIAVVSAFTPRT